MPEASFHADLTLHVAQSPQGKGADMNTHGSVSFWSALEASPNVALGAGPELAQPIPGFRHFIRDPADAERFAIDQVPFDPSSRAAAGPCGRSDAEARGPDPDRAGAPDLQSTSAQRLHIFSAIAGARPRPQLAVSVAQPGQHARPWQYPPHAAASGNALRRRPYAMSVRLHERRHWISQSASARRCSAGRPDIQKRPAT